MKGGRGGEVQHCRGSITPPPLSPPHALSLRPCSAVNYPHPLTLSPYHPVTLSPRLPSHPPPVTSKSSTPAHPPVPLSHPLSASWYGSAVFAWGEGGVGGGEMGTGAGARSPLASPLTPRLSPLTSHPSPLTSHLSPLTQLTLTLTPTLPSPPGAIQSRAPRSKDCKASLDPRSSGLG